MENLVRVVLVSRKEMWMTEEKDVAIRAEWKWNQAVGDILISFFKLKWWKEEEDVLGIWFMRRHKRIVMV